MIAMDQQGTAGQAVYSPVTLQLYNLWVLGMTNHFLWKCPTPRILAHFNQYISANHLDIGVGTGYFLDRCQFPKPKPRIGLMDLNPHSLAKAAHCIARYTPETYQRNVLAPIAFDQAKFDSISINYLLHCLPGKLADKALIFDYIQPLMNPGAVLFGSTVLGDGVPCNIAAKLLMAYYNKKGIFSNRDDALADLKHALQQRFKQVNVEVIGCVALFSASC